MKRTLMITMLAWSAYGHGQLKKMFDREALYQHFSGVVSVYNADSTLFEACYGMTDRTRAIDLKTRFDIGSVTKQFTAAAILHLVKDDEFKLHDPINPLLGRYASEKWKKVTVHQLLTHTSGIPSLFQTEQGLEIFFPEEQAIALDELIGRFRDGKLLFSPGEEFSYSNSGYILLAAIIQEVSGIPYETYMQRMFEKYELEHTSFSATENSARPYYGYRNDLMTQAPKYHSTWFVGAGGIYTTVEDLSKWIMTINSDDFLTDDLREKYLESHTSQGYGYGWVHTDGKIGHDGGNAGFISHLSFNPESLEHIIVMTNRSFESTKMFGKSAEYVTGLVKKSWDLISGKDVEVLPDIVKMEMTEGKYKNDENLVQLEKNDTALWVCTEANYPSRMIFNTPLQERNDLEIKMLDIAKFLKKRKYWSLASLSDGEMKFVMYSGLMSVGMRMLKKQTGGADEFVPYYVEDGHGVIRMKGPDGILDLIVYFDEEGKIQGIFEHGFYEKDKQVAMLAYPIGKSLYYLDGLPYGEKSATLKVTEDSLTIYQMNRSIVLNRK